MSWLNTCKHKPLGPQGEPMLLRKNKIIIHTMVGTLRGTDSMFRKDGYGGTESHFGTSAAGEKWQWQDTDYQADAQLFGNDDGLSIENEDWGIDGWHGVGPVPPFTDAQVEANIDICVECCVLHDIPPVLLPDTNDSSMGIGWHRMGIDPWRKHGEKYSLSTGKICPGDARIEQIRKIIIPETARRVNALMAPTSKTPHVTKALEANQDYRAALRQIPVENRPNIALVVEEARRNARQDFRALKEYEANG